MKKITIGFILFLTAWQLQAANTLKIGQYQVLPTTNFVVQLEAENTNPFVAFQVDIPIPTGFKYVDGSAVLNASRVSGHALSANLLTGNILRLIGYSIGNTAFLGNSGTLVSFTLKSGAVPATFPLELNQALLGDSQSNNILTSSINGQVTVLAPNISLSAIELNYGRIPLETVSEQSFQINNTGNSDLIVNSLNFNDAQFSTTEPANFTIAANSSRNILVRFTPSVKATLAKQLQIGSNDPDQPTSNIALNAVAFAVNEIHTGNITAASSTTAKLDFTLNNMETFTGFQFDLNLPSPMIYNVGTAQLFRSQDQTVSVNQVNSQTLRLVVFSAGNKNFSGTNGKVLSLDFLLKGVAGYYYIGISNVIIANAIGENIISDSYQGYLQISSPDIETSSQINFGDVSILSNSTQQQRIYNYGQEPLTISQLTFSNNYFKSNQTLPIIIQPWNYFDVPVEFAKAVKGSAAGTMKIICNDPDENPYTVQLVGNAFTPNYLQIKAQRMKLGDSKVIPIEIENEEPFVAIQFDLSFPEGLTPDLNAIALSPRKQDHLLAAISLSNTSVRIIAYSPSQKAFTGKSGSVLTIPFMSNGLPVGTYNLTLSNSLLSNIKSENILYSVKNGVLDVMLSTWVDKPIIESDIQIYPSPASDRISISPQVLTETYTFELMDMRGMVVLRKLVDASKNTINIESITNGLYMYKLINKEMIVKTGKVLKK
ncbi:MAG: choice-of-anchor D domain-containing protein [Paludibacter sp.]